MKNLTEAEKRLISIKLELYGLECGEIFAKIDLKTELTKIKELTDKLRDELIVMFSYFE